MSISPDLKAPPLHGAGSESAPDLAATRVELLRWFTVILSVVTSGYLGVFIYPLHNWRAATVAGLVTIAGLFTPTVHRKTESLAATTHYFAAIIFVAVLSVATFTGGLYAPVIMWLVTIPMAAIMLNGPRTGLIWLGVVTVEVILICLIAPTEFARTQTLTPSGYRLLTVLSLVGMSGAVLASLYVDSLTIAKANRSLHYYATRDGLTGLLNHRLLISLLERHASPHEPQDTTVSLILFDIDHFKRVNDQFGHAVGDLALQELARRVTDCLRETDYVGRYGGEEFLCILPNCPLETARTLAESIRQTIEGQAFVLGVVRIPISVSLGVSAYDAKHDRDGLDALRRADRALYEAKRNGRNRTCVDIVPNPIPNVIEVDKILSSLPEWETESCPT